MFVLLLLQVQACFRILGPYKPPFLALAEDRRASLIDSFALLNSLSFCSQPICLSRKPLDLPKTRKIFY